MIEESYKTEDVMGFMTGFSAGWDGALAALKEGARDPYSVDTGLREVIEEICALVNREPRWRYDEESSD